MLAKAIPNFPLRPSGERGRGPRRRRGRVRWVLIGPRASRPQYAAETPAVLLQSPTSPQPSPPPGAERESVTADERLQNRRISSRLSHHADILELPGIAAVEVFRKQALAVLERRPVAVHADHLAKIGMADFQDALKVDLVRLDDAALRMLDRPDHAGQHGRGDLQRGRVVVRRHAPRFFDRQARAVPIDTL